MLPVYLFSRVIPSSFATLTLLFDLGKKEDKLKRELSPEGCMLFLLDEYRDDDGRIMLPQVCGILSLRGAEPSERCM